MDREARTAAPHRTGTDVVPPDGADERAIPARPVEARPSRPVVPTPAPPTPVDARGVAPADEEIRRIEVADEDRLAFRVGVNLLTLAALGAAGWLVVRLLVPGGG